MKSSAKSLRATPSKTKAEPRAKASAKKAAGGTSGTSGKRSRASHEPPKALEAREALQAHKTRGHTHTAAGSPAKPRSTKPHVSKPHVTARQVHEIEQRLSHAMPEPRVELDHANAWQLLIATILSAQSTDRRVNMVTPALFARFPTPAALGDAEPSELEGLVKSTGFFRNKAKAIRAASRAIAEQFGGEVPRTMEELITLPGVARKTANVVLGGAYRLPSGIPVDTHAGRVSRRLGLSRHEDPVNVERDLCSLFAPSSWVDMGHRLILHGRYVCLATTPRCTECPLNELCESRKHEPLGSWQVRADREGQRVATRDVASRDDA